MPQLTVTAAPGGNPKRDAKLAATIERIWGESLPYSCEAARPLQRYLSARRIVYLHDRIERSDSLRFHPHLSYFHGHRQHTCFPAILGAIRDRQGQLLTLQRIYLSKKGGKANVINPKKMLPFPNERTLAGAAIPLGAPELGVLGVAEGLETALAVASVTPYPVWSAVNATLLARFEPPEGVHTLLIWADRDHSLVGEKAANELKQRLLARGIRVYVFLPAPQDVDTSESLDWNEVLQQQGTQGFPTIENLLSFQEE